MALALEDVSNSAGLAISQMVSEHFTRKKEKEKKLTEAERIGQEVGAIGGVLKPGSLTFLDQRRFNNIAIALTKLGLSNEVVYDAVMAMDESVLTPNRVELLVAASPTADDIEAIAPYDGDPILLARVERFWYHIHKVPHFTNRLSATELQLYWEGYASAGDYLRWKHSKTQKITHSWLVELHERRGSKRRRLG